MDLVELMLSSTGRIGRVPFLIAGGVLLALAEAYQRLARPALPGWAAWLVYAAVLFSTACLLSKRLHDRGRAGWWAFVPVIAIWIAWPAPHDMIAWAACAVLAAVLVDLGLAPGQPGRNRFG